MKPSLYLETTIPSYLAARPSKNIITIGRQAITHEFYKSEWHKYELHVSDYVLRECSDGNVNAAKRRLGWLKGINILKDTPDVKPLAATYQRILNIPEKNKIDSFHLAVCCIYGVNILLSWNFKHLGINSMLIIKGYNDTHGLSTPQMVTPDALVEKYKEVDLDE